MGSICLPDPCPSLSHSKDRQGLLQLVSITLKRSHFRALFSIFLLVFRGCCLTCLHAPFYSSALPQGPAGLHWGVTNGEWVLRTWADSAAVSWLLVLGCSLLVISCALGLGWDELEPVFLVLPELWLAIPPLLLLSSPRELGQRLDRQNQPGRQCWAELPVLCAPALAEQGVQSLLPPHTAFPVLLLPGK